MKILIDTFNYAWHSSAGITDIDDFTLFAKSFFQFSLRNWRVFDKCTEIIYAVAHGSFRYKLYPGYKQNRKIARESNKGPAPTFKRENIYKLEELMNVINIPFIHRQNYEADDIIGSLVKNTDKDCIIVSTDKDYEQLVSEKVHLFRHKFGWETIKDVKEKYEGLYGQDLKLVKALAGDTGDNIIGLVGIGPKKALKLVKEHKNIENIDEYAKNNPKLNSVWDYEKIKLNEKCVAIYQDLDLEYKNNFFKIENNAKEVFAKYELLETLEKIKGFYISKSFKNFINERK
jgi:DNA polymerase-1